MTLWLWHALWHAGRYPWRVSTTKWAVDQHYESERRESNPRSQLGKGLSQPSHHQGFSAFEQVSSRFTLTVRAHARPGFTGRCGTNVARPRCQERLGLSSSGHWRAGKQLGGARFEGRGKEVTVTASPQPTHQGDGSAEVPGRVYLPPGQFVAQSRTQELTSVLRSESPSPSRRHRRPLSERTLVRRSLPSTANLAGAHEPGPSGPQPRKTRPRHPSVASAG
jgi:hypothetical protein